MPRVFIVQESPGRNYQPAQKYGDLEVLLDKRQIGLLNRGVVKLLRSRLHDFSDEDYLVLSGDPVAICMAGIVAAQANHGRLKLLKWDRRETDYLILKVDLS